MSIFRLAINYSILPQPYSLPSRLLLSSPSGVLFAVLFAIPALAYRLFGLNEIVAFWFAYIMTRPPGASFADWFAKPYLGGLGLGDARVTFVLTILIIGFVGYLTVTHKDMPSE